MLKIGITGGIGTGKTTVCLVFEVLGIPVFNADLASRTILKSDPAVIEQVRKNFGDAIYDNEIPNRKELADIVFRDPEKLKILNDIIHPAVFRRFESWTGQHSHAPYVIKEAALIFEASAHRDLHKVIVVRAPEHLRINRIQKRDHVGEEEIRRRMKNQWTEEEKLRFADFVINNDEEQLLIPQVLEIHQLVKEDAKLHVL